MRMAPSTDISASRSCGGAPRPGRSGAAASAVSGGGFMAGGGRSYQWLRRGCMPCCRTLGGSCGEASQSARGALERPGGGAPLLFGDERLDRRGHVVGDLDDDHVGADVLDRLVEVDLPAVEL